MPQESIYNIKNVPHLYISKLLRQLKQDKTETVIGKIGT